MFRRYFNRQALLSDRSIACRAKNNLFETEFVGLMTPKTLSKNYPLLSSLTAVSIALTVSGIGFLAFAVNQTVELAREVVETSRREEAISTIDRNQTRWRTLYALGMNDVVTAEIEFVKESVFKFLHGQSTFWI